MLISFFKTKAKVFISNYQEEKKPNSVRVIWNDSEGAINKVFSYLPPEDLIEVGLVSKNLEKVVEELNSDFWSNEANKINDRIGACLDSKQSVLAYNKKIFDRLSPQPSKQNVSSVSQLFCKMLCRKEKKQEEKNPIREINRLARKYRCSTSKSKIDFTNSVKRKEREATAFLLQHGKLDKETVSKGMRYAAKKDSWCILSIFLKCSNENLRPTITQVAEEIMADAQLNFDTITIRFLVGYGVGEHENPFQVLDRILR